MSLLTTDATPMTAPGGDTKAYRSALGCFGTGVALVTAFDEAGEARAITINSFTSVSLTPPLVLWCLDDASRSFAFWAAAERYAINLLADGEADRALKYARHERPVLTAEDFRRSPGGSPLLDGAIARFDCRAWRRDRAGDHLVIYGEVTGFDTVAGVDGLGFFRGGWTTLGATP